MAYDSDRIGVHGAGDFGVGVPHVNVNMMSGQYLYGPNTMVYPDQKIESIYAEVIEPPAKEATSNRRYVLAAVAAMILAVVSVALTLVILSGALNHANPEPLWNSHAEQLIESTERPPAVPLPRAANSFVLVSKPQPRKPIALRQLRVTSNVATQMQKSHELPTTAEPVSQLPAVNGIFWSDSAEATVPGGFQQRQAMHWKATVKAARFVDVREGCGRMQNRLVELADQVLACARYRQNNDQIQGELFSFYLAQQLGIPNVVPVIATVATGPQWSDVAPKVMQAQWKSTRPVILSRYLDDLEPAYIPELLRDKNRHLHPSDVKNMTRSQIQELVQWSDLIVFDYLTANLDRVVNNLYNLQWNSGMMAAPAHNLLKDPRTGLLVFLDNESGLVHGYRLLDKYQSYHKSLLQSLCVFRKHTVAQVRHLLRTSNEELSQVLQKAFQANSPGIEGHLPFLPPKSIEILRQRLKQIDEQVEKCEAQYTPL
ncbi:extracellular serine/threonine protein kinase four-jointed-like isoform X1 [Varroa jacobsoni]|uniref:Four-jointed protein n=1 Tax=Varroa destructor TaxID=109461 RepID=A0A7M7JKI0_VARDE|nr:extracellular serine/threonine protein kinase four-jointed-like [Varroa destructor]XP_022705551.1 extracellular serine/threonine protein kinase four-jointed-like isoform X1 [Varroa jacobsoni]